MARKAKKQDNPTPEPAPRTATASGSDQGAVAGGRQPARLDRAGRLQALRPADHLPALPVAALRETPGGAGEADRRSEERLLTDEPRLLPDLDDPDEYRSAGAFIVPEEARWDNIVKHAQADDIKVRLDNILELLEKTYPDKLKGLLPRIYAGSNLDAEERPRPHQSVLEGHLQAGPRRRGPDRPRLRVLHRRVRVVRGQARRRVLHARQHRPHARRDAGADRGHRLRPLLRLGRHVRAVRPLHEAQRQLSFCRAGEQGLHLPPVPDEPVHPRPRRQHRARQLLLRRPARRRSRPTTSSPIRRSTTARRARTAGAPIA